MTERGGGGGGGGIAKCVSLIFFLLVLSLFLFSFSHLTILSGSSDIESILLVHLDCMIKAKY